MRARAVVVLVGAITAATTTATTLEYTRIVVVVVRTHGETPIVVVRYTSRQIRQVRRGGGLFPHGGTIRRIRDGDRHGYLSPDMDKGLEWDEDRIVVVVSSTTHVLLRFASTRRPEPLGDHHRVIIITITRYGDNTRQGRIVDMGTPGTIGKDESFTTTQGHNISSTTTCASCEKFGRHGGCAFGHQSVFQGIRSVGSDAHVDTFFFLFLGLDGCCCY